MSILKMLNFLLKAQILVDSFVFFGVSGNFVNPVV
jgi:hypothetical protein